MFMQHCALLPSYFSQITFNFISEYKSHISPSSIIFLTFKQNLVKTLYIFCVFILFATNKSLAAMNILDYKEKLGDF